MALLSDIRSGLLGAGQSVGRGLGQAAGLFGEAVAQPLSQGVADIPDVMRFYEAQRMSQPIMAYDPAQLKPVTPTGIAGMLPQLRAAEKEAMQKPMLDALKARADLARAAQSRQSLAAQKTAPKTYLVQGADGQMTPVETYFDKISGERLISGTNQPLPVGSLEFGAGDLPTFQNLDTFNKSVTEEEQKLISLDKFRNAVKTAPEGLGRTIQTLNKIFQTLSADPEFKKGDLATGEARARLQGLIGLYKDEIVGGGVMTEQDALRVIEALGGEISAFNPSELTLTLIDSFRENSERKYQAALNRYNKAYDATLPTMAGKRIFSPREAYVNPYLSPKKVDSGKPMTREEKLRQRLERYSK
jgi:hypothetical protein